MVTNLDVVRAWYDSGNPDLIDPQIEWLIPKGYPGGGNYYGRDAVFNDYFPKLLANFDQWTATPDQLLDAGEAIVGLGHYRGRVKRTGAPVEIPFTHVWWVRNGKIVKAQPAADTSLFQQALVPLDL